MDSKLARSIIYQGVLCLDEFIDKTNLESIDSIWAKAMYLMSD